MRVFEPDAGGPNIMRDQIIHLLGQTDYVPANVPELLRLLKQPPHRQQALQAALRELEQAGEVARIKAIVTSPPSKPTSFRDASA